MKGDLQQNASHDALFNLFALWEIPWDSITLVTVGRRSVVCGTRSLVTSFMHLEFPVLYLFECHGLYCVVL